MKLQKTLVIFGILAGTIGCDQATKVAARQHLEGQGTFSYLGDTFRLTYSENYGAFLGLGSSLPDGVRTLIFVGIVAIGLIAFLIWLLRTSPLSKQFVVASALIIGGGIGNLIDRVVFEGGVTDFLNMGVGSIRTGIFNVADVWIVAGVLLLALSPEFREGLRQPEDDMETEN